jgi:hypothetical protein
MRDQTSPFCFAIHTPHGGRGCSVGLPTRLCLTQLRLYLHNHVSSGMNITLLLLRNQLLQVSYISWAWGAFPCIYGWFSFSLMWPWGHKSVPTPPYTPLKLINRQHRHAREEWSRSKSKGEGRVLDPLSIRSGFAQTATQPVASLRPNPSVQHYVRTAEIFNTHHAS